MAFYGYHRVSTKEQHIDRGLYEIEQYCARMGITLSGEVFCDKKIGKNFDRPKYNFIRNRIQPGDTLIITEMDRLGRNKVEILNELRYFNDKGVFVIILEIPTTQMDFSKMENAIARLIMEAISNMLIEMYTVFAQAELEKKAKRRQEGIEAKKRRGEWDDYGRPRAIAFEKFAEVYKKVESGEMKPTECQRQLDIPSTTYYRYVKEYKDGQ
jgi:DNA invertase Pin-like site-specific DNA recombinase